MIIATLNNRCELTISKLGRLLLTQRHPQGFMISTIDLGPATLATMAGVENSLNRLHIHAIPEEKAVA